MGLFAIEVVLCLSSLLLEALLDIRGHIPRYDDFRPVPAAPAASPRSIMRTVAGIVAVVAVLSLAIWAMVWLAIRVL